MPGVEVGHTWYEGSDTRAHDGIENPSEPNRQDPERLSSYNSESTIGEDRRVNSTLLIRISIRIPTNHPSTRSPKTKSGPRNLEHRTLSDLDIIRTLVQNCKNYNPELWYSSNIYSEVRIGLTAYITVVFLRDRQTVELSGVSDLFVGFHTSSEQSTTGFYSQAMFSHR